MKKQTWIGWCVCETTIWCITLWFCLQYPNQQLPSYIIVHGIWHIVFMWVGNSGLNINYCIIIFLINLNNHQCFISAYSLGKQRNNGKNIRLEVRKTAVKPCFLMLNKCLHLTKPHFCLLIHQEFEENNI